MPIQSNQLTIKFLFEQNHTFEVPKYQRGYAWDDDAIQDFVEDISRCLKAYETQDQPSRNHFFGGIVTVRKPIPNSNRSNYEVIDGQQRLASFVMLVAALLKCVKSILNTIDEQILQTNEEQQAKAFLEETIGTIQSIYLTYKDINQLQYVTVPKLTLSQADNDFFWDILNGRTNTSQRASHDRIKSAWDKLVNFIDAEVLIGDTLSEKATRLQTLVNRVLTNDCSVIFMCSDTRSEAYQIFQVLNDRGVHLTDGDLLRASTLERLDSPDLATLQNRLANCWDRILMYPSDAINHYLGWYYSSMQGVRPKSSLLTDQFLEDRFCCKEITTADVPIAQSIIREAEKIDTDFAVLSTLCDGDWPYVAPTDVPRWDRERLRMLVSHLKHTNAMPLLLSLCTLEASRFADAVSMLERFVFRFKNIGNGHATAMNQIYLEHSKKIRDENNYSIETLRQALNDLVQRHIPETVFKAKIRELKYSPRGGNSYIRYLLITLEDYKDWYESGAQGTPTCRDKVRVFDFSNTTLEHIYPRSASNENRVDELEIIKHTIGNLTILGPDDNADVANQSFSEKRSVLQVSNLKMNRNIGEKEIWGVDEINSRTEELVAFASKVFVP